MSSFVSVTFKGVVNYYEDTPQGYELADEHFNRCAQLLTAESPRTTWRSLYMERVLVAVSTSVVVRTLRGAFDVEHDTTTEAPWCGTRERMCMYWWRSNPTKAFYSVECCPALRSALLCGTR